MDAVLLELGLQAIRDRQVGGAAGIRGISGGEMRRVSIGTELVASRSIIILDEPTSGLDSHTASHLLESCKEVHSCQASLHVLLYRYFVYWKIHKCRLYFVFR